MLRNLIIFFIALFVGFLILLFKWSGYEFPDKKKHSEIPFFPRTTKDGTFTNKRIDSIYVHYYELLKKTDLLLVSYRTDSSSNAPNSVALFTKSFKTIFQTSSENELYYSFDNQRKILFIVESASDTLSKVHAFNVDQRRLENISLLSDKELERMKDQLEIVKHYTVIGGYTKALFLSDRVGKIYFATPKDSEKINKEFTLKEQDNFDFSAWIVMAGDSTIHNKNITLFDKTVVSNNLKRLFAYGTPSSPGGDGNPPNFDEDKGWFDKWRWYFFKMKLGNEEVEFKTDLYYNSETYFDELNDPKTNQDTLLYYSKNRFYQFYKNK